MVLVDKRLKNGRVVFDQNTHTYTMHGKKLSGITSKISEYLGIKYNVITNKYMEYGKLVHEEVEKAIKIGDKPTTEDAIWVLNKLDNKFKDGALYSETVVSDFNRYASVIDLLHIGKGKIHLIEIKTGLLNLQYIQIQLGIYWFFLKQTFPEFACYYPVGSVYGTKEKTVQYVAIANEELVKRIIYKEVENGNTGN